MAGVSPRATKRKRSVNHHAVVLVNICDIRPASENDSPYKPVDPTDPAIIVLAESFREHELREPLVLSLDGYILSGHQRFAACKLAGLALVPCRYEYVRRDTEPDRFLTLLREYNRQRVKTIAETMRESIIDVTPEEARAELVAYRRDQAELELVQIVLKPTKGRPAIRGKLDLMRAICAVIDANRAYWPLSVRMIHYRVCQIGYPVLRHDAKTELYLNNLNCYRDCSDHCTRGRVFGNIPFSAIADETRPVTLSNVYGSTGPFIAAEIDAFL